MADGRKNQAIIFQMMNGKGTHLPPGWKPRLYASQGWQALPRCGQFLPGQP